MPTVITHTIVGLAAGKTAAKKKMARLFWDLTIICSLLPDLDVLGFRFGIAYGDFFGHRGFFHSLFFALLVAIFAAQIICWRDHIFSKRWWRYLVFFFFVSATHGVLDAFTNGGLGVALFSPFNTTRYFFPWRPIHVAPIGIHGFFGEWGLRCLASEALWIWLPLAVAFLLVRAIRE